MQSQVLALEDVQKTLEAKVLQEHQELEAATAQNKELSDQIQAVTKALEEKCKVAVTEADHKMSLLQVGLQLLVSTTIMITRQMSEYHFTVYLIAV